MSQRHPLASYRDWGSAMNLVEMSAMENPLKLNLRGFEFKLETKFQHGKGFVEFIGC